MSPAERSEYKEGNCLVLPESVLQCVSKITAEWLTLLHSLLHVSNPNTAGRCGLGWSSNSAHPCIEVTQRPGLYPCYDCYDPGKG
jgi:hypothetical protein